MHSSAASGRLNPLPAGFATAIAGVLLVGCGLASYLVIIKLRLEFDPSYVSSCNLSETLNCDAVQTSRQSSLFGYPLALFGLATYAFLLVLTTFAAASRRLGGVLHVGLVAAGGLICELS